MSASSAAYPPIADYALIGDCHSAALVSGTASIDWCCMPRFDSGSLFARILDWEHGGCFELSPSDTGVRWSRSYLDDTLVLSTTIETRTGSARVLDCFVMVEGGRDEPRRELVRIVEGTRGELELQARIAVRFDYAELRPWLRHHGHHHWSAIGGNDAVVITADTDLAPDGDHDLRARFVVRAGHRIRFTMTWYPPERLDPSPPAPARPAEVDRRLEETIEWWRRWADRMAGPATDQPEVRRSALVLKALTHAPTGAVVAAATTSLPEALGGTRNWDYRFSWVRDSVFTVRSLGEVGALREADGFRRFVERSAAGSAESLQVMYGVGGERRLTELELPHLQGYCGSRPVRVGNGAARQLQLDLYGYLLDLAWRWHERGRSPNDDYWRFLSGLVEVAAARWQEPDCGIWEVRGEQRHFVHSKVMCWSALDRGIRLSEACAREAPRRRWARVRDEIRTAVERDGYDARRGVFRRSFRSNELDASLLLLPAFGFCAYDDERMVRTATAIAEDLSDRGFIKRYVSEDGLECDEGTFLACTFWLAEVFARQGRVGEAREVFERAAATANDVGIFSEELDAATGAMLGNVPQGLTHLSHVAAAVALARALNDESVSRAGT
jgi:GH15 family glucan-1,4-alpha-glucosidase